MVGELAASSRAVQACDVVLSVKRGDPPPAADRIWEFEVEDALVRYVLWLARRRQQAIIVERRYVSKGGVPRAVVLGDRGLRLRLVATTRGRYVGSTYVEDWKWRTA